MYELYTCARVRVSQCSVWSVVPRLGHGVVWGVVPRVGVGSRGREVVVGDV